MRLLLATVVAAAGAQRGATPSGHALLLGTQRTGTTWAMAELDRSPCVSTTSELFIQFKWERGARMACLRMLYGDADARDRSLRAKCSAKFRGFLDKSRAFASKNNAGDVSSPLSRAIRSRPPKFICVQIAASRGVPMGPIDAWLVQGERGDGRRGLAARACRW